MAAVGAMEERLLNNRYRLVELVGSGGMATVYKGMDTLLRRPVAIKVLRHAYADDPSFLARFQQEARAAARLDHPNVVTVYDVGQDDDLHYIVMEYVEGTDLKTLVRREGRLSVGRAVDITAQIAAGVGHAHKAGIIHCDVKPQNVLVTPGGVVKVTDFGIARALSESGLTDSEMVWGSPLYFSPEQAAGERPLPASDVYSIGVVLYEMLVGAPPFQAEKPTALALMHLRDEPPPLSARNPHVPPQLEWIVRKLLAKEPSARYRTAEQLALVLKEYQARGEQATGFYAPQAGAAEPPSYRGPGTTAYARPAERSVEPDWRTWLLGAVAFVAVIGLVPLWATVYLRWTRVVAPHDVPSFATPTPTTAVALVPDVQGLPWEEARAELEAVGLRFTLEEEAGADAAEGTVVRQDPSPGETAAAGTEVVLYIAGPPAIVEVPDVVDVPAGTAHTWLEEALFQVVEDVVWSTRPISLVVGQEPPAGTQVQAGSVVTLTVSGGTEVPIEVGANLGDVIALEQAELLRAGFRPGDVMSVSLRWRALGTPTARYIVFIHLFGPGGSLVAQDDREPLDGLQPTDTWTPGIVLWDRHRVAIPPDAPAGTYRVWAGMYLRDVGRLTVVDPGTAIAQSDSILLAEVEVRP
jgi:tRNA A-37 threonylcarbamoyl transferase component Bud32